MNGAFHVGAVGLGAQQRALETIANNISNVNTPAFKRSQVRFTDMVSGAVGDAVPADLAAAVAAGAGVRADAAFMMDEQGQLQRTGRAMDLAVDGAGFIELMGPNGQTLLWRGGALRVGEDGLLASESGLPLKAAISVPADAVGLEIAADGAVRARTADEADPVELGRIMLVRLDDPGAVQRLDGGFYAAGETAELSEAEPGQDGAGLLVQGSLESSSVELSTEMVQLMLVQRAYAASAQVVQAADQLMALANGLKR